jgi:hypothetical protein
LAAFLRLFAAAAFFGAAAGTRAFELFFFIEELPTWSESHRSRVRYF